MTFDLPWVNRMVQVRLRHQSLGRYSRQQNLGERRLAFGLFMLGLGLMVFFSVIPIKSASGFVAVLFRLTLAGSSIVLSYTGFALFIATYRLERIMP